MDSSTRDKLVEAAMRLFHEQGYSATGVATILREAGVNSGSLYHFFPSKESLLEGVLERYFQMLQPVVMNPVEAKSADPVERIFALLDQYRGWMRLRGCRQGCPIGNLALEVSDNYPEARKLIEANFQQWHGVVRGWLEQAADRFPPGTDIGALAEFVLTVMEGGIMQMRARDDIQAFDTAVAQLRRYFDLLLAGSFDQRPQRGSSIKAKSELPKTKRPKGKSK